MIYEFIENHGKFFPVEKMCQVWKISRSGYYAWKQRGTSLRQQENERLMVQIREAYDRGRKVYGSPRITKELQSRGIPCGENRVARLMRRMGLQAKHPKQWKRTTDSRHRYPVAPNLLQQRFTADTLNRVWVSDITYIWTREGWLYVAAILDLYSRKIIGWSMQESLSQHLVLSALRDALRQRNPDSGLIFHSDRGWQYANTSIRNLLGLHGILQSMSGTGNCYDNAVMESFFHSLKTEWVGFQTYATRSQARQSLFDYIEIFYNRIRRHSSVKYYSPNDYEMLLPVS